MVYFVISTYFIDTCFDGDENLPGRVDEFRVFNGRNLLLYSCASVFAISLM